MWNATDLLPQGVMHQDVCLVEVHPYEIADLRVGILKSRDRLSSSGQAARRFFAFDLWAEPT